MPDGPAPDWKQLHLWQIQPLRDGLMIASGVGLVWLGYKLSIVAVPMLLALTLAYLFEPIVMRMTSGGRVTRPFAAVAIIVLAALLVIVPAFLGTMTGGAQLVQSGRRVASNTNLVVKSINAPKEDKWRDLLFAPDQRGLPEAERERNAWVRLRDWIVQQEPRYQAWQARGGADAGARPDALADAPADAAPDTTTNAAPSPSPQLARGPEDPTTLYIVAHAAKDWVEQHAPDLAKRTIEAGGGAFNAAASFAAYLGKLGFTGFLCAFFFYFFCTGWGKVLQFWEGMIPERRKGRVIELVRKMDAVIAGFVRGRITIAAIMVLSYSACYWLIGVPAWLVLGLIVGVMTIIPYAAGFIGIPVGVLLLALEPATGWRGDWWWILASPLMVTVLNQFFDDYILTPRIQGKSTGMDMPTVLFASVAGGALAGFYGLLLAIPIAACAKILVQEVFWPRFEAWLAGRATDFIPIEKD